MRTWGESGFCWTRFAFGNIPYNYSIRPSEGMCVSAHLGPLYGPIIPVSRWECMLVGSILDAYQYDHGILAQIPSECFFRGESGREEFKRVVASIVYNHSEGVETIIPPDGRSGIFYFKRENGICDHVCIKLWEQTEKQEREYAIQWAPPHAHRHNPGDIVFYPG
jgi:hypothetical protein